MRTYEVKIETKRGEVKMKVPYGMEVRQNPNGNGVSFEYSYNFFHDSNASDWRQRAMEIEELLNPETKLKAIKAIREMFPWLGLKAGKEVIEAMIRCL